jgi:cobalt/nickel transport system permease protein
MAHIHLEDGAFSPLWVIIWSLLAAGAMTVVLYALRGGKMSPRKLAIAAMCTSVGFAVFQVSIPIFGGIHLNLTPLIGILAGPALGSISVLAINVFSAAVGHGGWGMIGPNTLVNMVEVILGYYGYRLIRARMRMDRFTAGAAAATLALTVSALMIVGIVVVSGLQDSENTAQETLRNMLLLAGVNIAVGVVEGFVTGYIVSFIGRIRPDLLADAERVAAKGNPAAEARPDA